MKISVVIPVLNEAGYIGQCLQPLQLMRSQGHEVIVVDGGSSDGTLSHTEGLCDVVISSDRGRAIQMNAGVSQSSGVMLMFLHADTLITFNPADPLAKLSSSRAWGCFTVHLSATGLLYRIYSYCINLRARVSGIITGDQVMFMTREMFDSVGGFPEIPLMEDVAISRALKVEASPVFFKDQVITSSRRWERYGLLRTMLKMWVLRGRYALGASPAVLAKHYE